MVTDGWPLSPPGSVLVPSMLCCPPLFPAESCLRLFTPIFKVMPLQFEVCLEITLNTLCVSPVVCLPNSERCMLMIPRVCSVFCSALFGMGGDGRGGLGSGKEQRRCQQLHPAVVLLQERHQGHCWYLGRGEERTAGLKN